MQPDQIYEIMPRHEIEAYLADITKVSVKSFGAMGDGVTDDSQAFIKAIANAKATGINVIYVPAGNYLINSSTQLVIDFSSILFKGDGYAASTIRFNNANGGFLFHKSDSSIIYQCGFEDIAVNGNNVTTNLISMPDEVSELKILNCVFTSAVNAIFNGGYIDTTWIDRADITNAAIGFNLTQAGSLYISGINFFNLTTVFKFEGGINSLFLSRSYCEDFDYLIYGDTACTSIGCIIFDDVSYLKNSGTHQPFYFVSQVGIALFLIKGGRQVITQNIGSIFNFASDQTSSFVYLKLIEAKIEATNGYLSYLVQTTAGTQAYYMQVFVLDGSMPMLNMNSLVNGNAYANSLTSGVYLQTNDQGIKTNSSLGYAGRISTNTSNKRLQVTDDSSINWLIPRQVSGSTANRPSTNLVVGDFYFDTTLNKPVWCKTTSPIVWVDATGASV